MSLQINKRQFKQWIAALDSGKYDWQDWPELSEMSWSIDAEEIDRDFAAKTSVTLSYLHDCLGWPYSEIATLLELVYVHKILD